MVLKIKTNELKLFKLKVFFVYLQLLAKGY